MWTDLTDLDVRVKIEECRLNLLVAEMRFRIRLLRFQGELECFLLQVQAWAATHREEGGDTDDRKRQSGVEA
jgi:hypothetical protein